MTIITVTSNADSGQGSLREAIALAQSGDSIQFASNLANQTITLSSGQLTVNKNLTIDGAGATGLTISGNNQSRVFDVVSNSFTLRNLTVANGKTTAIDEDGAGAGIRTASGTTLVVENSLFQNNSANGTGGGAIYAGYQSTNTVIGSQFIGNSSAGNDAFGTSERGGGAIAVKSESQLTVTGSKFTNNTGINGGAINTVLSGVKIEGSTFNNNDSAPGGAFGPHTKGYGGAIYTDGAFGKTIEINNSRFDGNRGAGQGGGLFLYGYASDKVIVENSTIVNNSVAGDTKGDSLGGGLRASAGALDIKNTTFANNKALQQGGGLWVGETTPVTISNSTFYGNRAESLDGTSGIGGGIALINGSSPTNISNTIVANNYAGFQGGGFAGGGASTTLSNSIVANNVAHNGGYDWNIQHQTTQQFSDGGGNIQWSALNPDDLKVTTGATSQDPHLVAFVDNGGAVQTPLLPGSSAVVTGTIASSNTVPASTNSELAIDATSSNDSLLGGTSDRSNDTLSGASGGDTLLGATTTDTVAGASGGDTLLGATTTDTVAGASGGDTLLGATTTDTVAGVSGGDTLLGATTGNNLVGSEGNNFLTGGDLTANPEAGAIAILNGSAGSDPVALGNYDDSVISFATPGDYASSTDFNTLEDQFLVQESSLSPQFGESVVNIDAPSDQTTHELVGVVAGVLPNPVSSINCSA